MSALEIAQEKVREALSLIDEAWPSVHSGAARTRLAEAVGLLERAGKKIVKARKRHEDDLAKGETP